MKVLLLEDDKSKSNRIGDVISTAAGGSSVISTCDNVAFARQILNSETFDLLVLDVQVPIRSGESAEDSAGIELLKELLEDGAHKLPRYVVGITGVERLFEESSSVFSSHGWVLLQYSPASTEWADSLRYFVNHVAHFADKGEGERADIVVITALEHPEFHGLRVAFPELKGPRPLDRKTLVWEADLGTPEAPVRMVATFVWQMGLTSTAILAERLITSFRPKFVAMTGICAGYADTTRLGDVLVATQSWEWQGGKLVGNTEGVSLQPAPEPYRPSPEALSSLKQCTSSGIPRDIIGRYFPVDSSASWTVHFGPMVSGLSVVASKEKMEEVRKQHRKVMGLEMESYAIYAAARFHPANPHAAVLKGVCDFGDVAKGDDYQLRAAVRSALVLRALVDSRPSFGS